MALEEGADSDGAAVVHPQDVMLPDAAVADLEHILTLPAELVSAEEVAAARTKLIARVEADAMTPYYEALCERLDWPINEELRTRMADANDAELHKLEEAIKDADENYGDVEIRDNMFRKAHFFCRIGDKKMALQSYAETFDKAVGAGSRLDIVSTLIRMGLLQDDTELVRRALARGKNELKSGGDWERMNKLKVYEALHLITIRNFADASKLLLRSVASFTASEIMTFDGFVFQTIIVGVLSMDRPEIKAKLIDAPEVLQVVANDEDLKGFLFSLYNCQYQDFMKRLVPIARRVRRDRYLGRHFRFFIRNIRLRAYRQFLEPFKAVTVQSMATAFGVSPAFIEEEVASFIANGRLQSAIDKVKGVVESKHANQRDSLYLQSLKDGDGLLNKIQKLSRVVDI